ncbi:MAG: hypothetical protein ABI779_05485 [Acidobacteriota bacterium]
MTVARTSGPTTFRRRAEVAMTSDAARFDAIRRLDLDPQESYTVLDQAAIWRIRCAGDRSRRSVRLPGVVPACADQAGFSQLLVQLRQVLHHRGRIASTEIELVVATSALRWHRANRLLLTWVAVPPGRRTLVRRPELPAGDRHRPIGASVTEWRPGDPSPGCSKCWMPLPLSL